MEGRLLCSRFANIEGTYLLTWKASFYVFLFVADVEGRLLCSRFANIEGTYLRTLHSRMYENILVLTRIRKPLSESTAWVQSNIILYYIILYIIILLRIPVLCHILLYML